MEVELMNMNKELSSENENENWIILIAYWILKIK